MEKIIKRMGIKKFIAIIISVAILLGTVTGYVIFEKKSLANNLDKITKAFNDKRIEVLSNNSNISLKESEDESNKETRVIIQLKEEAAVDKVDYMKDLENPELMRGQEEIVLNNQKNIISKVENITGNKVLCQTGYLMNSISIKATKDEVAKITDLEDVLYVYEAETYEASNVKPTYKYTLEEYKTIKGKIDTKLGLEEVRNNNAYTGEGLVVGVIDTGVNYFHQDMQLDKGVEVKCNKELWEKKIHVLGYGRYFSEKVPFGYNYIDNNVNIDNNSNMQGYNVSSLISNKGQFMGVAKDAQILALKVFNKEGATTDQIVRAMEDAVILGADVINMSLESENGVVIKDDFEAQAIRKVCEVGVICVTSAGNASTIDGTGANSNRFHLTDIATLNSAGVAEDALTVASAYLSMETGELRTYMSDYSSWGTTNNLGIKPEITAPGQNIITAQHSTNEYNASSGTALATAYISGCSTLLVNDIKNDNIKSMIGCGTVIRMEERDQKYRRNGDSLKAEELTDYIKNNLMNTAEPIYDTVHYGMSSEVPYSVRKQGAGLVNINAAINNNVIATYNDVAKVELGEVKGSKDIEIKLTNYGNEDVTYTLKSTPMFEPKNAEYDYCMKRTNVASLNATGRVTVPARDSIMVKVNINVSGNEDTFIEGFIQFIGENVPTLSMPVLGFNGDWNNEPIIDKSIYEEGTSYLKEKEVKDSKSSKILDSKTCLIGTNEGNVDTVLGMKGSKNDNTITYDGQLNAFSPNEDGVMDNVYAGITQLRNISEIKYAVLDEDMNGIRVTGTSYDIKRNNLQELSSNVLKKLIMFSTTSSKNIMQWDGKIYDKDSKEYVQAKDGQYYIQLQAKISDDKEAQLITIPVKIDTQAPNVSDNTIQEKDNTYSYVFKVEDNVGLEDYMYLYENGKVKEYAYNDLEKTDDGQYILDISNPEENGCYVMFSDVAGNQTIQNLKEIKDSSVEKNKEKKSEEVENAEVKEENGEEVENAEVKEENGGEVENTEVKEENGEEVENTEVKEENTEQVEIEEEVDNTEK